MSSTELSRTKAFPSSDEKISGTYIRSIYSEGIDLSLQSVHFALKTGDLPLIVPLNSFGKLKIESIDKSTIDVSSADRYQQTLISNIRLYPTSYRGKVNEETLRGCHYIAYQLEDIYNIADKNLQRKKYCENDYFGVLAAEAENGNTLIAFDNAWTIAGIKDYIDSDASREMIRPQALREYLATLHPVLSSDEPVARWKNRPILVGDELIKETLKIYMFHDFSLNKPSPIIYMIFAPISSDSAEKIFLYLYRDVKVYSTYSYLVIRNLPLSYARDFRHLFPVDLDFFSNYVIIKSNKLSQKQLELAYETNEVIYQFPRIDDILGCFATYLLAEATQYLYEIRWENQTLYMKNCGYIQTLDLRDHFVQFLNDIYREHISFRKLPNFATAVNLAKIYKSKCFHYLGDYHIAINEPITVEEYPPISFDSLEIEMNDPLRSVHTELRNHTYKYLSMLGYEIKEDPEIYKNNIPLGYRTYEIDENILTVYYYKTTYGEDMDLVEINGKHISKVKEMLEKLIHKGFFFTSRMNNILRNYPNFIPSLAPLKRDLPKDPLKLIQALDDLL